MICDKRVTFCDILVTKCLWMCVKTKSRRNGLMNMVNLINKCCVQGPCRWGWRWADAGRFWQAVFRWRSALRQCHAKSLLADKDGWVCDHHYCVSTAKTVAFQRLCSRMSPHFRQREIDFGLPHFTGLRWVALLPSAKVDARQLLTQERQWSQGRFKRCGPCRKLSEPYHCLWERWGELQLKYQNVYTGFLWVLKSLEEEHIFVNDT